MTPVTVLHYPGDQKPWYNISLAFLWETFCMYYDLYLGRARSNWESWSLIAPAKQLVPSNHLDYLTTHFSCERGLYASLHRLVSTNYKIFCCSPLVISWVGFKTSLSRRASINTLSLSLTDKPHLESRVASPCVWVSRARVSHIINRVPRILVMIRTGETEIYFHYALLLRLLICFSISFNNFLQTRARRDD